MVSLYPPPLSFQFIALLLTLIWVGEGRKWGGGGVIPPIGFPLKLRNGTSCNSGILQHLVTFY